MVLSIFNSLFGRGSKKYLAMAKKQVAKINKLEPLFEALSDAQLKEKTFEFKQRVSKGEMLDSIMVEAFALVREAAKRTLNQRHYDVQLVGGVVLHHGMIAEMRTGEGKTLVSTLPIYLNALSGKGVHVVTVNDYLASRDSKWMGQVFEFLGLSVGCIMPNMSDSDRKAAYDCDITYATNSELGFDYLRDNMKSESNLLSQREFNFAIIDEVDSILIDEARTPLIISGPSADRSSVYRAINDIVKKLSSETYELDEKNKNVSLTEEGQELLEVLLQKAGAIQTGTLYDTNNVYLIHHVNQALRAHKLFNKNTDYIVRDGKIIIIDEFTGRMMEDRRYSDGLHQAIEAKEGVNILNENQTLASITYQNYFRMYPKIAGMTGTGATESEEFGSIYGLSVVTIPTHRPVKRIDHDDEIYATVPEKMGAIILEVKKAVKMRQPVLVGTVSIESSEELSDLFNKNGIVHSVLNARFHAKEAEIIAQAGRPSAVTIATNMAGRGTDIQLGGNAEMRIDSEIPKDVEGEELIKHIEHIYAQVALEKEDVIAAGGLLVIGTERHESRRIDNQLRGRSGRQGDPGASKFFVSLQDNLMRIFGQNKMAGMLQKLGLKDGESIKHPWMSKALERAQKKVEAHNFDIRKSLLRFDDVMNDQRRIVYAERRELLEATNIDGFIEEAFFDVAEVMVYRNLPERATITQETILFLKDDVKSSLSLDLPIDEWVSAGIIGRALIDKIVKELNEVRRSKREKYGQQALDSIERGLLLQIIDQYWKEHLLQLDHVRQGIGLRAYGQKDPLNEYKMEALNLFKDMIQNIRMQMVRILMVIEIKPRSPEEVERERRRSSITSEQLRNIGRNDACPCESGKKYKHCCGSF